MNIENFENIFLSKNELTLLSEIGGGIVSKNYISEHLVSLGFLANYREYENKFVITPKGVRYLEFIEQKMVKENKDKRMKKFQFWISLIVTNLISFAALIVSIIALLKK